MPFTPRLLRIVVSCLFVGAVPACAAEEPKTELLALDEPTFGEADSEAAPTPLGDVNDGDAKTGAFGSSAHYLAWSFSAGVGQTIHLAARGISPSPQDLDTVLTLYRASEGGRPLGPALAVNDDCDDDVRSSCVDVPATKAGRYVALVRRYDRGGNGSVQLTLDLESHPDSCSAAPVACDATLPALGAKSSWRHPFRNGIARAQGSARHRGRDLWLRPSDPQWALAKFAYGLTDDDLKDEDVDVWLDRGCTGGWTKLGTGRTTEDDSHEAIEGVKDSGGWVFFPIPDSARLGIGRHRILFVVKGDLTTAEQLIEVLPADARIVVSDVDGTLTSSETAEFGALLTGSGPAPRAHAAELLWSFALRGYRIFYLTARPEWLATRTHRWLESQSFPPGLVHTTLAAFGASGSSAERFKTAELQALTSRFPGALSYGVGNTASDTATYATVGLAADHAFLYRYSPGARGTRVDDYGDYVGVADAAPLACNAP